MESSILEQKINNLQLRLAIEEDNLNLSISCHKKFSEVKPLYLKMLRTKKEMQALMKNNEKELNKEMQRFKRFKLHLK